MKLEKCAAVKATLILFGLITIIAGLVFIFQQYPLATAITINTIMISLTVGALWGLIYTCVVR